MASELVEKYDDGEDIGGRSYTELVRLYNLAVENIKRASLALEKAKAELKDADDETRTDKQKDVEKLVDEVTGAYAQAARLDEELKSTEALDRAKARFRRIEPAGGSYKVKEPDIYVEGGRSFLQDLYLAQVKNDPGASARIGKHHSHEIEKRAITSATMGGIIPPAYLVELYAKASRNGRVLADGVNGSGLPDVGMSVVLPRITTASAAGVQATENTALTTQDIVETDLSVPVRTLGGFLAVSRQAIERAAYSDQILFEDLIARYWALLDTQCISGSGASGQILGILNTAGISTSTASTTGIQNIWPKIADVIQQVNVAVGGLGYTPDKIFMHPRRWGQFEAYLDTQNRPVFGISGQPAMNVIGTGNPDGYGLVGYMHGLPVFTDANIPTNLGVSTNEDRIIVMASRVVHLFERTSDPVTLSFEQQAGTSLQVQLIAYGYAAFTAGRYPAATGVVSGAGLGTPTF